MIMIRGPVRSIQSAQSCWDLLGATSLLNFDELAKRNARPRPASLSFGSWRAVIFLVFLSQTRLRWTAKIPDGGPAIYAVRALQRQSGQTRITGTGSSRPAPGAVFWKRTGTDEEQGGDQEESARNDANRIRLVKEGEGDSSISDSDTSTASSALSEIDNVDGRSGRKRAAGRGSRGGAPRQEKNDRGAKDDNINSVVELARSTHRQRKTELRSGGNVAVKTELQATNDKNQPYGGIPEGCRKVDSSTGRCRSETSISLGGVGQQVSDNQRFLFVKRMIGSMDNGRKFRYKCGGSDEEIDLSTGEMWDHFLVEKKPGKKSWGVWTGGGEVYFHGLQCTNIKFGLSGYSSLGCYKADSNALVGNVEKEPVRHRSVRECAFECRAFEYFALKAGKECWCTDDKGFQAAEKQEDTHCASACLEPMQPDDGWDKLNNNPCGGDEVFSFYQPGFGSSSEQLDKGETCTLLEREGEKCRGATYIKLANDAEGLKNDANRVIVRKGQQGVVDPMLRMINKRDLGSLVSAELQKERAGKKMFWQCGEYADSGWTHELNPQSWFDHIQVRYFSDGTVDLRAMRCDDPRQVSFGGKVEDKNEKRVVAGGYQYLGCYN
ncbi:unnamed protein product, partial [Amoebophrya sp. A120]|eukprot:GSA120T00011516001.1